jgi:hypothetical protein
MTKLIIWVHLLSTSKLTASMRAVTFVEVLTIHQPSPMELLLTLPLSALIQQA